MPCISEIPDSGRRKSKGIEQVLGASDVEQTIICKGNKDQQIQNA